MFMIEDEWHGEPGLVEFATREDARAELDRLAGLPWDKPPNQAPCAGWKKCGRSYHLIEYDTSQGRWRQVRNEAMLEISAKGIVWLSAAETEVP